MTIKFRKPTSPAFNPGEIWLGVDATVEIISVRRYPGATGHHSSDYGITYWVDLNKTQTNEKDCWSFQVRYNHSSDELKR